LNHEEKIVAKSKQPAIPRAESESDSFDALQVRFLSLTSRLEVLKDGNTDNVPNGLVAAAFVFRETTEEMVELQGDIESWHDNHEHTAKAPKGVQS
jgi:hypothetical protein